MVVVVVVRQHLASNSREYSASLGCIRGVMVAMCSFFFFLSWLSCGFPDEKFEAA